jgi:hypothetical protein
MDQARQQGSALPGNLHQSMLNSVDATILPSEILNEISSSLKKQINESEVKQLITWYESDLGKKITAAEEQASTPEAYQMMAQSAQTLLGNTKRVEFAKKLDKMLKVTDMTLNMQESSGIAVYSALSTAMDPSKPLQLDKLEAQLAAQRPQIRAQIEQMVIISFVYAYRNIDIEDLKKYENFLSQENSRKFNNTVVAAMNRGMEASVSKLAKEIAIRLKKDVKES